MYVIVDNFTGEKVSGFWDREPLTSWQQFMLCRELNCGAARACRECAPPLSHQAAYNMLTRIGYYLATDLSRQTKRENMATLVLLDLAQQIVRLESKMAGKEVR